MPEKALAQAINAHRQGDLAEAEKGYRAVLKKKRRHPTALHMLGVVQLNTDRPEAALKTLTFAAKADPQNAEAFHDLGVASKALNSPDAALAYFAKALAINPSLHAAEYQSGLLHRQARNFDKAEASFQRFIQHLPAHPHGYLELGTVFRDAGDLKTALAYYEKAVQMDPKASIPHQNCGVTLADLGEFDRGIAELDAAIHLQPGNMQALHVRALAIRDRDGIGAGLRAIDEALDQKPDDVWCRISKAELLFEEGRFAEAWQEYAWRKTAKSMTALQETRFGAIAWTGESFANHHVLLRGEQGLGEQTLFTSMVPDLVAEAASVVLECEPRLIPLLARSFPDATVIEKALHSDWTYDAPCPDLELAIGDLGARFRTTLDHFPGRAGFLQASGNKVQGLREKYVELAVGRPIVGVSWRSFNPLSAWRKSAPLAQWTEILTRDDVFFVDVQYGDVDQERAEAKVLGINLYQDSAINPSANIDDAAAQLAALDMLVSTSNSCVHLAGGLNVPTVLLLPARIERHWYWFPDRSPNPWYPSVTVVRQKKPTEWAECLAQASQFMGDKLSEIM